MALPPSTGTKVFISYRRHDAGGHAGRLHEYLSRRFGDDCVFFDRSTIESGDVFPDKLRWGVEGCAVLLALIGPEWLDVRGDDGVRRLDDADDFVRQEIALAFEQGKKVIPVLFDDTPVPPRDRLPDPLKALASCDALALRGKTYEYQTQRRELVRLLAKVPGVPPPLPEAEEVSQADANRQRMLEKVRRDWIDGYLKDSLHDVVRIKLGLKEKPDVVRRPYDLYLGYPDRESEPLPSGRSMIEVFEEMGKALLILGAPGAGKTTLLLDLTRDLLDQACEDPNRPIPVIFKLASWAAKRRSLTDWMLDELDREYQAREPALEWIKKRQVLPLLDGLDEVAFQHRGPCIEAINAFRREHPLVPLAVCSRAAEYEEVRVRITLAGALMIQPLSPEQVRSYLDKAGEPLDGVRTVLKEDETLWELLETPLMLSVVTLAYHGRAAGDVRSTGSLEQRRSQLFANYIERMLKRPSEAAAYTREQTLRWLNWLARSLISNNQSSLYLEWMQPDWLTPRAQWTMASASILLCATLSGALHAGVSLRIEALVQGLVFGADFALVGGLVGGLRGGLDQTTSAEQSRQLSQRVRIHRLMLAGLAMLLVGFLLVVNFWEGTEFASSVRQQIGAAESGAAGDQGATLDILSYLSTDIFWGLVFGLLGLAGGFDRISPAQALRWSWQRARRSFLRGLGYGLLLAITFTAVFAGPTLTIVLNRVFEFELSPFYQVVAGLIVALLGVWKLLVIYAIPLGLIFGLFGGWTTDHIVTRARPNEGTRRSLHHAVISFVAGSLGCGLLVGLPLSLFWEPAIGKAAGLSYGVLGGLIFGLRNGGFTYIKHYVLRVLLWRNDYAPLNYIRFLNYATERMLLRKVGGGYIFKHPLLMEYFATLQPTPVSTETRPDPGPTRRWSTRG